MAFHKHNPRVLALTNRRGITLFELLFVMFFFCAAMWLLASPAWRTIEIVETVTGEKRYELLIFVGVFSLTLLYWICIAIGIRRLRVRYGNLLYFPLMVGLPLVFAVIPLHPFSLRVYAALLTTAIIAIPLVLFFIQSVFLLSATASRKRNQIPEVLPPYPPDFTPYRDKPILNIKDLPPHPNVTQAWMNFHNSVGIHQSYAVEAYLYDNHIDEFRSQLSLYCQKLLLHYKQPSGYVRFWSGSGLGRLYEMIFPCAALDFDGARNWVEYIRETFPMNSHTLSRRDERLILAMCAVIMNDDDELERINRELQKPTGWLDRMVTCEPRYWEALIDGLAERNVERCQEAIRIQSEEWYMPSLSDYCRLNIGGAAMTNLCRWRGIPVSALTPVIPDSLLLELP